MTALSLLFGAIVGLSLGLTGGGGAIFAVPLLVYAVGVSPRDAVAVSLAAVGTTSLVGFVHRWRLGEVELVTGLLFAIAGMLGAPLGTWLASLLSDAVLLISFAVLMLAVALRMWQQASRPTIKLPNCPDPNTQDRATCQRDAAGRLILNSRCAMLLLVVGVLTGVLTGMFGVGGGFVIVPALVLFSGMSIHRAVGTSLMVIALVSLSGIGAQWFAGREFPLRITALFVVGGVAGLFLGQAIGKHLSALVLQRVFAIAILAVAALVMYQNLNS